MKEINELVFDQEVRYSLEHTWAREDGELIIAGITDFAQNQLNEVIFVELPQVGDTYEANDVFGVVESVKSVSDLHMPIGGEIIETNEGLEATPTIINASPFKEAWMIKVKPGNRSELEGLLTAETYKNKLQD